jgi:hypothetical protein
MQRPHQDPEEKRLPQCRPSLVWRKRTKPRPQMQEELASNSLPGRIREVTSMGPQASRWVLAWIGHSSEWL